MTQTVQTAPSAASAKPLRFAMLLPTLLVDGILPIGLFKGLEAAGVAPVWALAIGCAPPLLNNLRVWLQSRRIDVLGILITASMASGVVGPLITGHIGSRIVTDCILNSAWGLAFLGSLLLSRPVIFLLIRSMVAGDDASRTEAWNGLWRYDLFRSSLRGVTATWGIVYFVEVLIELGLAHALAFETVVTIVPLINACGTLGLLVFTRFRMKATRKRLESQEHLTWPL